MSELSIVTNSIDILVTSCKSLIFAPGNVAVEGAPHLFNEFEKLQKCFHLLLLFASKRNEVNDGEALQGELVLLARWFARLQVLQTH